MIVATHTARAPRCHFWHRFFIIWPRQILIEGDGKTPIRARAWLQPMMRRYSETYRRWLWAMPGSVKEGSRP